MKTNFQCKEQSGCLATAIFAFSEKKILNDSVLKSYSWFSVCSPKEENLCNVSFHLSSINEHLNLSKSVLFAVLFLSPD